MLGGKHGGPRVNVRTFDGRGGWRGISVDPTGLNLPPEHGPWTAFRYVDVTSGVEFADLEAHGFHISRRKENE
jgi:hypothetical protein